MRRIDANLADAYGAERYTLRLRTFWFPTVESPTCSPSSPGSLWGGWLVAAGTPRSAR